KPIGALGCFCDSAIRKGASSGGDKRSRCRGDVALGVYPLLERRVASGRRSAGVGRFSTGGDRRGAGGGGWGERVRRHGGVGRDGWRAGVGRAVALWGRARGWRSLGGGRRVDRGRRVYLPRRP